MKNLKNMNHIKYIFSVAFLYKKKSNIKDIPGLSGKNPTIVNIMRTVCMIPM